MRPAGELMRATPDDHALVVDHHGPDHRIGTGPAAPALGERQRTRHVLDVGRHPLVTSLAQTTEPRARHAGTRRGDARRRQHIEHLVFVVSS
jgi:hypothetical protein